mgnify:CR=1 FL=1
MSSDKKSIPIKPVPADNKADNKAEVVSLYAEHKKIHPRHVTGLFANMRVAMVWLTQLVYFGFPWMTWNGRQAVLFDLVNRKFYFFGITFFPQDFIYVAALLMMCALGLFLWTTIAGRLWCGYACPQTVYTEVFLWFEHLIEGDRSKRIKLDAAPMSARKLGLKTAKHTLWIAFSLITGFTLVAYFTPRTMLIDELLVWDLGPWETFWIFFYAFATYGMAGFMREQVCKYMCPYARFQSVMFDADTLIISYDTERGEPRGTRKKGVDPASVGKGSCVDCGICVQVCPTGIDIRNGLQYECIGCAACIDACDQVMEKMDYPKGLIRYTTENAMKRHWGSKEILGHVMRPRIMIYAGVLVAICTAFAYGLATRSTLRVDVIKDRSTLSREVDDGMIANVYNLHVMNMTEKSRSFALSVSGLDGVRISPDKPFEVDAAGLKSVTVEVAVPPESGKPGSNTVYIEVKAMDDPTVSVREKTAFLLPR